MNPYENKVNMMRNYYYFKALLPSNYMKIRFKPAQSTPRASRNSNNINVNTGMLPRTVVITEGEIPGKIKHRLIQGKEMRNNIQQKLINKHNQHYMLMSYDNGQNDSKEKEMLNYNEVDKMNGFDCSSVNKHFNVKDISKNKIKVYQTYQTEPVQHYQYKKNLYLPTITSSLQHKKPRYDRESNWSKDIVTKNNNNNGK